MTTTTRNEAAERLRDAMGLFMPDATYRQAQSDFAAALAAEYQRGLDVGHDLCERESRRATVERIRAALVGHGFSPLGEAELEWIGWRLDEEAER